MTAAHAEPATPRVPAPADLLTALLRPVLLAIAVIWLVRILCRCGGSDADSRPSEAGDGVRQPTRRGAAGALPKAGKGRRPAAPPPDLGPVGRAAFFKVHGMRRVTMAVEGVVAEPREGDAGGSASPTASASTHLRLADGAADAVRGVALATELVLVARVDPEATHGGDATAARDALVAALRAEGLVTPTTSASRGGGGGGDGGDDNGRVPPHRVVVCSTKTGVAAAVRALEPTLHLESCPDTARHLGPHLPRVVLCGWLGESSALGAGVETAPGGLEGFFAARRPEG